MTPETPVERRLWEMAKELERFEPIDALTLDVGREAIVMLRDLLDNYECGGTVDRMISEFLARCGQEGTE